MQVRNYIFKASDGAEINCCKWSPDTPEEIKGVVELHHGLAEHCLRYDRLGSILVEQGYVFNAYDMRGHGRTAEIAIEKDSVNAMYGKLAEKNGYLRVVEDLHEIIDSLKKDYEGKPVYLLGHSFGSFVSQAYIEKYGEDITGCILCGTAGPRPALIGGGKIAVKLVKLFKGGNSIVKMLDNLAFGSYNKRIENPSNKNSWLSANEMNVQMYEDDRWCGFPLPTSFFLDMMNLLTMIHKKSNIKKVPANLPVYFIYGAEDPVGDYGKTITKLFDIYKKNGVKDLEITAYAGDRHEIFNENDKEQVEKDVLTWLSKH